MRRAPGSFVASLVRSIPAHGAPALYAAAVALTTLPMATLASTAQAQTERRTLVGSSVAIYNLAGRMTVEGSSGSDVVVEITRAGSDAKALRIESSEIGGRATLRVAYPDDDIVYAERGSSGGRTEMRVNDDGTWGGNRWSGGRRIRIASRGRGTEAWADIRVLVPTGKSVAVHLGVGSLDASRVNGTVALESASGRTTASDMRGSLSVDVGSGGASVRDVEVDVLSIDTGSGGVSMTNVVAKRCTIDTGSGGVTGGNAECDELSVDAGSGGVRLADGRSSSVHVDAGSGPVSIGLRNSPREVSIESGSGGVVLAVPGSLSADIDIETGSGGIETDFMLRTNRIERHRLRGVIGDGAGRIRIETGSGAVKLRRN